MKKMLAVIFFTLFSPWSFAADAIKVGVVNMTELYNKSAFMQKSNEAIQKDAKGMEEKLQAQNTKIKSLIKEYEQLSTKALTNHDDNEKNNTKNLAQKITAEQTQLNTMSLEFQNKIKAKQAAGLQKFSEMIKVAVEKIAKDKQINNVLNSNAIVYTDNSWIDITKEVEEALQKN